jgi:MYXO-CTERM domain-containing protein
MPSSRIALSFAFGLSGSLFCATSALAHIDLVSPVPRAPGAPDTNLSQGPCGQRDNGRLADKVAMFRPGQTIDVVWDVYVQHVSYFRIAFDADGDDSFSARSAAPNDPAADDPTALPAGEGETILAYVEDRTGDIDHVEQQVTLPNVTCDNCTLQLIQFTYGLPIARATYHQCADLVLSGPLSDDAEPSELDPDDAPGAAVSPGSPTSSGTGNSAGTGAPPFGSGDAEESSSNDGGCAFHPASGAPTPAWLAAFLFGLALMRITRRRAIASLWHAEPFESQ